MGRKKIENAKAVNTGIAITRAQADKAKVLAANLGCTRNALWGRLIEVAELAPPGTVAKKAKSDDHAIVASL